MKKILLLFVGFICMWVTGLCQNVGIGTTTPQRKLHIHNGTSVFSGLMLSTDATGQTADDGIHFGIQYQADNVGNRFGYLLIKENIPMYIGTNNSTTQIRILPSGNVGLSVTNPVQRLEIDGNIRLFGSGAQEKRIIFRNNANTFDIGSIGHFDDSVISIAYNAMGQSSRIYFDVKNAKMGIGEIPKANDGKVLINYNSTAGYPHLTVKESVLGDYSRLEFANTGAERVWHIAGQNVAGTGSTNQANDILNIWNSGWGNLMSFRGDGRIGIWTTSPATGYALSVNGKIMCEELRVQLSETWPDYVFADNYKLKTIEELEEYIQQNKHLPGIPAAANIEKEGIAIGNMQKRMMEKIEELTLYIIQLQKEIEFLKTKY